MFQVGITHYLLLREMTDKKLSNQLISFMTRRRPKIRIFDFIRSTIIKSDKKFIREKVLLQERQDSLKNMDIYIRDQQKGIQGRKKSYILGLKS